MENINVLHLDKDRFLEDGEQQKVYGETAIPRGKYIVAITHSVRFKRLLPVLIDVPQFSGIRIHTGNKPENTEGCILVGASNTDKDDNWISDSKIAFDALFVKIAKALDDKEDVTIEIV